ncbi:MAG: transporter suffix domain-containing protein [Parashewanella sp.]
MMKKYIGYALLIFSTIIWSAAFVVPALDFSAGITTSLVTTCIIIGEITFYLAILLLGKEVWNKIKDTFINKFKKEKSQSNPPDAK